MTLVSSIITRAYRESNIIPLAGSVSAAQSTEALDRLNTLVLSTVGNEAGDGLTDLTIGGTYDQSSVINTWLPDNVRLLLNLTSSHTYLLDPLPKAGQRLAIVDVDSNLATYNVVLNGNGRNIEGVATLTLSTNGLNRQWMYRADLGNWVVITDLLTSDQMPFPEEFDNYFVLMLAMRLNPMYGQTMAAETIKALQRARGQLNARYALTKEVQSDLDPRNITSQRRYYDNFDGDDFNTGKPWPWM